VDDRRFEAVDADEQQVWSEADCPRSPEFAKEVYAMKTTNGEARQKLKVANERAPVEEVGT
jgi:hypothetical protein